MLLLSKMKTMEPGLDTEHKVAASGTRRANGRYRVFEDGGQCTFCSARLVNSASVGFDSGGHPVIVRVIVVGTSYVKSCCHQLFTPAPAPTNSCLVYSRPQGSRHVHWSRLHRHRRCAVQRGDGRGHRRAGRGLAPNVRSQPLEPGDVREQQDYEPSRGLLRGTINKPQ